MRVILGIEIGNREKDAMKVQTLLTEYGMSIAMRLGMHDANNFNNAEGLLLVEFVKDQHEKAYELEKKLAEVESAKVRKMEF